MRSGIPFAGNPRGPHGRSPLEKAVCVGPRPSHQSPQPIPRRNITVAETAPPLRVLVTSDLASSPGAADHAHIDIAAGGDSALEALLAHLRPMVSAGSTTFTPTRLDDLSAPAIHASLSEEPDEAARKAALHTILQTPAFADFEARLRGIARFMDACPPGTKWVYASSTPEDFGEILVNRGLRQADEDPSQSFDLIVIDHAIGARPAHVAQLRLVATWAASLSIPVIAQAAPAAFGVRQAIHLPTLPDFAERINDLKSADLQALRADDAARWITLTIGRFLTRPAWVDPTLPFVETPIPERPETLPYAHAVWLAAAGVIRSLGAFGHAGRAAGFALDAVHADLGACRVPGLLGRDAPETSTDVRFDEEAATMLLRGGFTPLLDRPQDGVAAFAMLATLHRPNGPALNRNGSLAHQVHAGAAARLLMRLEGEAIERGPTQETAAWIEETFMNWYGAAVVSDSRQEGDSPPVDVRLETGALRIHLAPGLRLDGQPIETDLQLTLTP